MSEKHEAVASTLDATVHNPGAERRRKRTLGNVRLMHHDTNAIILVPTPSSDPNDPLNWYISPVWVYFLSYHTTSAALILGSSQANMEKELHCRATLPYHGHVHFSCSRSNHRHS